MILSEKLASILRRIEMDMERNKRNPLGVAATLLNVLHSLGNYELQRSEENLLRSSLNKGLREIKTQLKREDKAILESVMGSKDAWDDYKNRWTNV